MIDNKRNLQFNRQFKSYYRQSAKVLWFMEYDFIFIIFIFYLSIELRTMIENDRQINKLKLYQGMNSSILIFF